MDCIDRKALRDALYDADAITMNGVKITNQFPSADVAPVVLCQDCMYWTKMKDSAQGRCALFCHYPTGGWYCANGERKEDE